MTTDSKPTLGSRIKADPVYKKYVGIVEQITQNTDCDQLLKEARYTHNSERTSSQLKGRNASAEQLAEARQKDMSARARLTNSRVDIYLQAELLEGALKVVGAHVRAKYLGDKDYASTADARKAIVEKVTSDGLLLLRKLRSTSEALDLYIKDIDQANYGQSGLVELLKIMSPPSQLR